MRKALQALLGFGVVLAIASVHRFAFGLGASTNLTDAFPWGLWIGFDVLIGVATTAGGFTVAFAVYILRLHRYHHLARGAVLTAFLGYCFVAAALLFDLGRPLRLWHPMIFWNHRSVMFEVAWCVMLYNTVLFCEFAPEILGWFGKDRWGNLIHRAMPILAGAGVLLSTLHQSSLGTLYLIVPNKLHELWYTPWLPVYFFFTAIQCGLGMVIVEASLSHSIGGALYEEAPLRNLGRALFVVLCATFAFRFVDFWQRNVALDAATYERAMFVLEMSVGWILPLLVLGLSRALTPARLFSSGALAVAGVMLQRLNVAITGMERSSGGLYLPSLTEIVVTLSIVGVGVSVFVIIGKLVGIIEPEPGVRVRLLDGPGALAMGLPVLAILMVGVVYRSEETLSVGAPVYAAAGELESDSCVHVGVAEISREHAAYFRHEDHAIACSRCHSDTLPVTGPRVGVTYEHGTGFCARCHDATGAFHMESHCGSCHEVGIPEAITLRRGATSVRFAHGMHARRDSDCRTCHPAFPDTSAVRTGMAGMREGRSCGACHLRATDPSIGDCRGCHAFGVPAIRRYPMDPSSPGPVVFSHARHEEYAGGECSPCHGVDAARRNPWTRVTMEEIYAGRACGACHAEQGVGAAFSVRACARCHEGMRE